MHKLKITHVILGIKIDKYVNIYYQKLLKQTFTFVCALTNMITVHITLTKI